MLSGEWFVTIWQPLPRTMKSEVLLSSQMQVAMELITIPIPIRSSGFKPQPGHRLSSGLRVFSHYEQK
jgi:hypothetical protein